MADIEDCKNLIAREQDLSDRLNDLNVAATIIKVCLDDYFKIWYRELPTPVLNTCNHDKLFYSEDQAVCAEAFNGVIAFSFKKCRNVRRLTWSGC